jgi:hypothetical protein
MVLQSGGLSNKRTLLQTPTEHRAKTDELWQAEATPGGFRLPLGKSPGIQLAKTKGLKWPETAETERCPIATVDAHHAPAQAIPGAATRSRAREIEHRIGEPIDDRSTCTRSFR